MLILDFLFGLAPVKPHGYIPTTPPPPPKPPVEPVVHAELVGFDHELYVLFDKYKINAWTVCVGIVDAEKRSEGKLAGLAHGENDLMLPMLHHLSEVINEKIVREIERKANAK